MSRLVILSGEVKRASRSESESEMGVQSLGIDAKRGDLPLARVSTGNTAWRPEPVLVENSLDELRVGVKG